MISSNRGMVVSSAARTWPPRGGFSRLLVWKRVSSTGLCVVLTPRVFARSSGRATYGSVKIQPVEGIKSETASLR
jgi:hypothetical protein